MISGYLVSKRVSERLLSSTTKFIGCQAVPIPSHVFASDPSCSSMAVGQPIKIKRADVHEANGETSLAALTRNFKPVEAMVRVKAKRTSMNPEEKYR